MGFLSDTISVLNVPRFLSPNKRSSPFKFVLVSIIFSVFLFFTLIYFSEMFWLDIILILSISLVFLSAFYYIIRDKDDLTDEVAYSSGAKSIKKINKIKIKIQDLEFKKGNSTNAVERRSIQSEIDKYRLKISNLDSNLGTYGNIIKREVEEADRLDMEQIKRREEEIMNDLDVLNTRNDVETNYATETHIASHLANLQNLDKMKQGNTGYQEERKKEMENSGVLSSNGKVTLDDTKGVGIDIKLQNSVVDSIQDNVKELQKEYLKTGTSSVAKKLDMAKQVLKEERENLGELEKLKREISLGKITNYEKYKAELESRKSLRSAAAANDGLYKLVEQARGGKISQEVLERSGDAICERKVNDSLLDFALAIKRETENATDLYGKLRENITDSVKLDCIMKKLESLEGKEVKERYKAELRTGLNQAEKETKDLYGREINQNEIDQLINTEKERLDKTGITPDQKGESNNKISKLTNLREKIDKAKNDETYLKIRRRLEEVKAERSNLNSDFQESNEDFNYLVREVGRKLGDDDDLEKDHLKSGLRNFKTQGIPYTYENTRDESAFNDRLTRQIELWEEKTPEEIRDSVKSKEDIKKEIKKIEGKKGIVNLNSDTDDDTFRAKEDYIKAADSIIEKLKEAESNFS